MYIHILISLTFIGIQMREYMTPITHFSFSKIGILMQL